MGETYYDVLEVDPDASRDEIREAYRERVLETHPDHNDDPDAVDQFQRVSTAESVLTDGTERARYDRLGHDAYVRLADHASEPGTGSNDAGGSSHRDRRRSTGVGFESQSTNAGRRTAGRSGRERSHSESDENGRSHHARNRYRRQRATADWSAGWTSGTGRTGNERGRTNTTRTTTTTRATAGRTETSGIDDDGDEEFRYAVHDWDGDVDLEWDGRSVRYSTAVALACVWLLYPVFVYASVTPLFSAVFNLVLIGCTLGVVAYLLTMPRIAIGIFGWWGVVFPVGLTRLSPIDPFSVRGLVSIGLVWIPLCYAVLVWWALRP
ncbi:J domain-containing protein [Natrarchaeobius chitinivorans]|uniref:Molecular chaperone DnaJ n=1 Tax=Natrarchaeobius chitinivorans TaxID=1679083 RepID=A0A3N6MLX0_NATCH|nr:J domain-containing protein [Natrarchaeobius chitinivorans]RQG97031.1 molecular chaperone DnaJ [Natrarchaeobius chitinivorans]